MQLKLYCKSLLNISLFSILISSIFFGGSLTASSEENPTPTLDIGADVYSKRCVLCHGDQGMGEGILPLKLKNYPNTSLFLKDHAVDRENVKDMIVYGGKLNNRHDTMPPYGQELSWTETESVTNFIMYLRKSPKDARKMIVTVRENKLPLTQLGKEVYDTRCVLCHGRFGEGDGRMSKILKNPPPFDLTASRVPEPYLQAIIEKGGEAMGRSKHMPPWGDQLSSQEIKSVISYLLIIRD